MFDHIGICVTDFERSKDFYAKAIAHLSISLMSEISAAQSGAHAHAGFGKEGKPLFWIGSVPENIASHLVALATVLAVA